MTSVKTFIKTKIYETTYNKIKYLHIYVCTSMYVYEFTLQMKLKKKNIFFSGRRQRIQIN